MKRILKLKIAGSLKYLESNRMKSEWDKYGGSRKFGPASHHPSSFIIHAYSIFNQPFPLPQYFSLFVRFFLFTFIP
jgi:hypothetical protein